MTIHTIRPLGFPEMWHPRILLHVAVVAARSSMWEHGKLKVPQILANKKVELNVKSEIVCALLAMRKVPPASYCHDGTNCIIAQGGFRKSVGTEVGNCECKFGKPEFCSVSINI